MSGIATIRRLGPAALWAVVVLATAAILLPAVIRAAHARNERQRARVTLMSVRANLEELHTLRAAAVPLSATESKGVGGGGGLAGRVASCLNACGVPASALASFHPDTPVSVGEGARRQRAVITLEGVTLPKLGEVLAAWRQREPAWTITSIDLSPSTLGRGIGTPPPQSPPSQTKSPQSTPIGAKANQSPSEARASTVGEDLPLHAVISIEAIFTDEAPTSPMSPTTPTSPSSPRSRRPKE